MPSPSDLPWWGWILCALGGTLFSLVVLVSSNEKKKGGCFGIFVGGVVGLASVTSAA
jgi:hypothetical protein